MSEGATGVAAALPGVLVDTSSNNGDPSKWDWAQMKAAGVRAVIAKATEGPTYANPYYAATIAAAKSVGIDHAAYHFAHFTDPVVEAAWFRSVAGPDAKVLDSETNKDAAWQNAFLVALNLPGYEELDYGSSSTLPRTGIRSLLWPAAYGSTPGFGDLWQDTDRLTVAGCPVQLDGSIWTGSQSDYDAFFHGLTPPPTPPPTGGSMATTPPVSFKVGQEDIFQVSGGALYHKYNVNGAGWKNESLAGPSGGTAAGCADNKFTVVGTPQVKVDPGQLCQVVVEDSSTFAHLLAQSATSASWGHNQLP